MLVMELLVLLLIAYEVFDHILAKRAAKKRKELVDQRVSVLRDLMARGLVLQLESPRDNQSRSPWEQDVEAWESETKNMLKSYSAQAETAFLQHGNPVDIRTFGSMAAPYLQAKLIVRIANLQGIIEKPDVYL